MFIKSTKFQHVDRIDRVFFHEVHTLRCDTCGKEWESRNSKSRLLSRKVHSCSKECKLKAQQPEGAIAKNRERTNIERYGVSNFFAAEICKKKIKETCLEKYGVEHVLESNMFKEKAKKTNLEHWGVENAMKSPEVKARVVATMQERYGVDYAMQMESVKEAMRQACLKKHGTEYPMQNHEVMQAALDKRFKSIQERGGSIYQSKPEQEFCLLLKATFGAENVLVQQRLARKWSIDFYIKNIDTYVQFDGVHWHGLDKPIEEIRASESQHDRVIYAKWIKDRELDAYVVENKLRLVRVTDLMFKNDPQGCISMVSRMNENS